MATSALPTVISNLVSTFKAASSLTGVVIYDGIEIDREYPNDMIAVGHDGNLDSDEVNAGSVRQRYESLGARNKMENGVVNCVLWAQNGTADLTSLRTRAFTTLGAIETIIRTDASLSSSVIYSDLDQGQMSYIQSNEGGGVQIAFTISYTAKI